MLKKSQVKVFISHINTWKSMKISKCCLFLIGQNSILIDFWALTWWKKYFFGIFKFKSGWSYLTSSIQCNNSTQLFSLNGIIEKKWDQSKTLPDINLFSTCKWFDFFSSFSAFWQVSTCQNYGFGTTAGKFFCGMISKPSISTSYQNYLFQERKK